MLLVCACVWMNTARYHSHFLVYACNIKSQSNLTALRWDRIKSPLCSGFADILQRSYRVWGSVRAFRAKERPASVDPAVRAGGDRVHQEERVQELDLQRRGALRTASSFAQLEKWGSLFGPSFSRVTFHDHFSLFHVQLVAPCQFVCPTGEVGFTVRPLLLPCYFPRPLFPLPCTTCCALPVRLPNWRSGVHCSAPPSPVLPSTTTFPSSMYNLLRPASSFVQLEEWGSLFGPSFSRVTFHDHFSLFHVQLVAPCQFVCPTGGVGYTVRPLLLPCYLPRPLFPLPCTTCCGLPVRLSNWRSGVHCSAPPPPVSPFTTTYSSSMYNL